MSHSPKQTAPAAVALFPAGRLLIFTSRKKRTEQIILTAALGRHLSHPQGRSLVCFCFGGGARLCTKWRGFVCFCLGGWCVCAPVCVCVCTYVCVCVCVCVYMCTC